MLSMRANVFCGVGDLRIEEVPLPRAGVGEAVIRITLFPGERPALPATYSAAAATASSKSRFARESRQRSGIAASHHTLSAT